MATLADRTLVMGILNVTPDSFSDGGRFRRIDQAVAHGEQMIDAGADVVDVGGESTRPGAEPVEEREELRRVLPVVEGLSGTVRISVDTTKPGVARAAVAAGASLVNDISGTLWPLAAELGVGWVSMHMRGTPRTMQSMTDYDDVVAEVHTTVLDAAAQAREAGVDEVWVDPGIGFAKTAAQNLSLLAALPQLVAIAPSVGARVLVGTSRKGFLGQFGAPAPGAVLGVDEREEASLATAVWAMVSGAGMVRVHEVADSVRAARLVAPWSGSSGSSGSGGGSGSSGGGVAR